MNETIAIFGLGAIGFGMAANLLQSGYSVNITVYRNSSNVKTLKKLGATVCSSKPEAVESSDIVILCLPNSHAVSRVMEEIWSTLTRRHLVVDTGTSSVRKTRELSERLQRGGVSFVESPVAGGKAQADGGELGAFVGASSEALERVTPVLEQFCRSVEHFGPVGAGGKAKLISNYLVLNMVQLIIETFYAADVLEIDWNQFYETILKGSGNSVALQRMVGSIVDQNNYSGYVFNVKNTRKDLEYIFELSENEGLQQILRNDALRWFQTADDRGFGDLMVSELLRKNIRNSLVERTEPAND